MAFLTRVKKLQKLGVMLLYLLLTPTASLASPSIAYGVDECNEQKLRDLGVIIAQCEDPQIVCEDNNSTLFGGDNVEKAFNYFLNKGLTHEQSAGILGNMIHESGVNPEKIQIGGSKSTSKIPSDAGSLGWGIIQWTPGEKIIGLAKEAGITIVEEGLAGKHIYDLDVQLDLVWWHLTVRSPTNRENVLPGLKATTTVAEATEYFEDKVEGAGKPQLNKRIENAENTLALYGNNSDVNNAGSTSSGCGSASTLDDGFVVFSQYDPKWKDLPYASSTIGESGCGPSAMAMIINAFGNTVITPVDTSMVAANANQYVPEAGSKWTIGPVLAEHYGLTSEPIATDIEEISTALSAGKMVITAGQGALPFTTGGHFIAIRGITADGKWLIGDSGHRETSSKEWDPTELILQMKERDGSAYAISK
jgi:hypothetical protein